MIRIFLILFILGFVSGCSHYRDVRPGEKGIHRVITRGDNPRNATRNAIDQAENYCDEYDKGYVILKEKVEYRGDMKEKEYKAVKKSAKVAKAVGGSAIILGRGTVRNVGRTSALVGIIADGYIGKAYRVKMKFKCM